MVGVAVLVSWFSDLKDFQGSHCGYVSLRGKRKATSIYRKCLLVPCTLVIPDFTPQNVIPPLDLLTAKATLPYPTAGVIKQQSSVVARAELRRAGKYLTMGNRYALKATAGAE